MRFHTPKTRPGTALVAHRNPEPKASLLARKESFASCSSSGHPESRKKRILVPVRNTKFSVPPRPRTAENHPSSNHWPHRPYHQKRTREIGAPILGGSTVEKPRELSRQILRLEKHPQGLPPSKSYLSTYFV